MVLELTSHQIEVIGQPIPACESDPISRAEQQRNMTGFVMDLCRSAGVPVDAAEAEASMRSDPKFTHWVVVDGRIAGEARSVEPVDDGQSFAFVRLFAVPEMGEYGCIESARLRVKADATQS